MQKINVIGTSGSGKSTLARALARQLGYPYIEMDAVFWRPNWTESPDADFFPKLAQLLEPPGWVLDGNYTRTIPIKWQAVDTVIWIDRSFGRTLYQVIRRSLLRLWSGEELWPNTGNRQTWGSLFSRKSIVWWSLQNYFPTRRKYLRMMADPQYAHITFIHLRSAKAIKNLLDQLQSRPRLLQQTAEKGEHPPAPPD